MCSSNMRFVSHCVLWRWVNESCNFHLWYNLAIFPFTCVNFSFPFNAIKISCPFFIASIISVIVAWCGWMYRFCSCNSNYCCLMNVAPRTDSMGLLHDEYMVNIVVLPLFSPVVLETSIFLNLISPVLCWWLQKLVCLKRSVMFPSICSQSSRVY